MVNSAGGAPQASISQGIQQGIQQGAGATSHYDTQITHLMQEVFKTGAAEPQPLGSHGAVSLQSGGQQSIIGKLADKVSNAADGAMRQIQRLTSRSQPAEKQPVASDPEERRLIEEDQRREAALNWIQNPLERQLVAEDMRAQGSDFVSPLASPEAQHQHMMDVRDRVDALSHEVGIGPTELGSDSQNLQPLSSHTAEPLSGVDASQKGSFSIKQTLVRTTEKVWEKTLPLLAGAANRYLLLCALWDMVQAEQSQFNSDDGPANRIQAQDNFKAQYEETYKRPFDKDNPDNRMGSWKYHEDYPDDKLGYVAFLKKNDTHGYLSYTLKYDKESYNKHVEHLKVSDKTSYNDHVAHLRMYNSTQHAEHLKKYPEDASL